tara:strand:+ start:14072 stop:18967 length:4896 start_codon:yes stop_codon:yes gene_type:complete
MTVTIANTNLVDSFNTWRLNTNLAATTISNNVVTVSKTGAVRGGTTKGDGHIKGIFSANDLRSSAIRGGNTTNQSAITLHSNTTIEARTFTINANTEFTGNVNFTTTTTDRIILGDISRIRVTGGNSGDFLRKTGVDQITAAQMGLRQLSDLSSNSAHIILSSSNTAFSEELNTPDLRFSAGTDGQDVFRVYGDGDSTGGNSDLLIQLVSADGDSNLKIQTNANNTVHTFGADGNFQSTGRLTTVGITTSGTILPSGASVNLGSGSAKFLDGNFSGTVTTDKLNISTTAGDGVSSDLLPATHNARDLGNTNYQWRNIFSSGTSTLNNVTIGGTLGTTGDLTAVNLIATGDVDLGNATTDTITVTGQFDSDLIPSTDNARDLGSSSKEWKDLYIDGVANIDELSVATGSGQGVSTSLIPKTDGTHNLGSTNREWQNLFIDGTAHIDTLDVDENATFGGTITATSGTTTLSTGAISVANITTLNTTGLASLDGGIDVDGVFTVADSSGNMATTGTATVGGLTSLNGGIAVDTNKFTVADTSGNVATAGSLTVAGTTTLNGDVTLGDSSTDTVTINGTIAGTSTFNNLATTGATDIGDNVNDTLTVTASVDSNFIPTGTVNLGSNSSRWTNGYITNLVGRNITLGASGDASGTNSLTIFGDITIDGDINQSTGQTIAATAGDFTNATVSTLLNVQGNADLGNAASDTITFAGTVDSDIIPNGASRDLGSTSARWDVGYFNDINVADDFALTDDLTVGGDAGVTGTVSAGALNVSGATNLAGDVDFDGAITRDGGTVLFDTNGVLNQASIATGAIASAKLASVVTGASVGSASAVPVITFNSKGQITAATTATVAGVTGFAVGNAADGKKFTITTADGSTFDATVGAGSIGTNEMSTISGLTATTYGSATQVPVLTVNAKGRVTAASQVAVAGISSVAYTSANNNVRVSTGDGKTHDLTVAPATDSVRGVASFDSGDFDVSSGAVTLKNATTGAVLAIAGTANETDVSRSNGTVTVGLPQDVTIARDLDVTRDVSITGNLSVAGTTTTVNSTTVSIADPIFELGADGSDDNLDRGIIMKYNNGTDAKKAFIGFDDSDGKFAMIPDATDTASVISGTVGTLKANIEGNITGNLNGDVTGDVTGNISSSGTSAFSGTLNLNGATVQNAAFNLTGALSGNATTATTLQNARTIGGVSFNGSANINLPGVNTAGNQNTSGNAATATKLAATKTIGGTAFDGSGNIDVKVKTVSEGASTADHFLTFVSSSTTTNVQDIKEDADLKYKPSTGTLTSAIVSAGTNFLGDTFKNTSNQNVITKTGTGVGENLFHGNSSTSSQWASGVNIDLRWSTDGSPGSSDPNAGSISSLTGADASIFGELRFPSGGVLVAEGDLGGASVSAGKLASNAVTTVKIANGAVTGDKIASGAVTTNKIGANAVGNAAINNSASFTMGALTVDNITLDGNEIDVGSGNLTLDVNGDINLNADGGDVIFQDNTTTYGGISNSSGNIRISSGNSTMLTGSGANATFAGSLGVNGTITATNDITAFGSLSDITLKENIQPIENALDKVSKIRGVTFNYIDTPDKRVPGVIAQELQEVLPEAVYETENGKLAVRYDNTIALLLEAIKELKKEVEELKGK